MDWAYFPCQRVTDYHLIDNKTFSALKKQPNIFIDRTPVMSKVGQVFI